MNLKDIEFAKIFSDKHGDKVFNHIVSLIKKERIEECNEDYIEAIFKVAFMDYFGLSKDELKKLLEHIKCTHGLEIIKELHNVSIKTIQNHIHKINTNALEF